MAAREGVAGLLALGLAACGDPGATSAPPLPGAVPGAQVRFALDAVARGAFYDFPFPSELRTDAQGRPILTGVPVAATSPAIANVLEIAGDQVGYPTVSTSYFRFDEPVAEQDPWAPRPGAQGEPLLLVDVDPESPERGALVPVVAATLAPDAYAPEHLLGVAPMPGATLAPGRLHAAIVLRALGDAGGEPLGVPAALVALARDRAPAGPHGAALLAAYRPVFETLDALGVDRADVAAATVFRTSRVVEETARLGDALIARGVPTLGAPALRPGRGTSAARFCELAGQVELPQHQTGEPPYETLGTFELGADALPRVTRTERVPFVITIPRAPMPTGGYPLVTYAHGSGGLSTQVADRGPVKELGGERTPGEGPAHVAALHGFATFAHAHPLNPERLPGASDRAYLNFDNLKAYRDTFRQGHVEERLLLRALAALEIPPGALAGCDGPSLPAGATTYRLDTTSVLALGQSMGAQYATMLGATEPAVRAVAPTGSGGHWGLLIAEGSAVGSSSLIGILLGTNETLTVPHPGLMLLEMAWEPADPIVYAPHLLRRPLAGHAARHVYQPVGEADTYFAEETFDAMAAAYGTRQAGEEVWPGTQRTLALVGAEGLAPYPVRENVVGGAGLPVTAVVVHYRGDGLANPHDVFMQLPAARSQWACFFASARGDVATVFAPGDPDAPCP
ncbi:MAG: hypothetical protein IT376_00870 [Polyangiaceae bacterium]|nr:hypothetical protein [Polyangiaceae bacterium]